MDVAARAPVRARADRIALGALGCAVVAIAAIDAALITRGHVLAGTIADGALLVVLLNFAVWQRRVGDAAVAQAIYAVALVALARVVAAGMPVAKASEPLADLLVALPIGYAAIRFAPVVGVSLRGLFTTVFAQPTRARVVRPELDVPLAGGLLGLVAYLVGAPALATTASSPGRIALAAVAVTATVIVEELLFRGLLQTTLQRAAGRLGFIAAAALFACAYLASGSVALVLTLALAGVVFAYGFAQTGNLRGAILGHYELAIGAFIVWPLLFGRSHSWLDGPVTTLVLAVAVVLAVAGAVGRPLPAAPA